MAKLFGFSIEDPNDKKKKGVISPVPPNNEDGADYFLSSGFYGQYVDIEGVFRTEYLFSVISRALYAIVSFKSSLSRKGTRASIEWYILERSSFIN